MSKIGIIDADLIYNKKGRFPNLCSMKISAYYKSLGYETELLLNYDNLADYEKVFISKVFIKTEIPFEDKTKIELKNEQQIELFYKDNPILNLPNVEFGGTGFFYDKAPKLPNCIEHIKPDYHLYDSWVNEQLAKGVKARELRYYTDFSIGMLTRGCIKKCEFCVNKHYNKCSVHSSVYEFLDEDRPYITFLDDNFFACPKWKEIIDEVKSTNKRFQFKQGLDERLLTKDKIEDMVNWKYIDNFIFAFDNYADKDLIIKKLNLLYEIEPNFNKQCMFYLFCGFDRNNKYDEDFWKEDIKNVFRRCKILAEYSSYGYLMRHENVNNSQYKELYVAMSSWINQPIRYIYKTFRQHLIDLGKAHLMSFFDDEDLDFVPKDLARFGKWTKHIRQDIYERKLNELKEIDKNKISELIKTQEKITYADMVKRLDMVKYKGTSKEQQMKIFNELYEIEKDGKYYVFKGAR